VSATGWTDPSQDHSCIGQYEDHEPVALRGRARSHLPSMRAFEGAMGKRYACVQNDFARTGDSASARTSTLGERGWRGPKRHAIDQHRNGKKQRCELE